MAASRSESEFFLNSVPNKKLCQNTDGETILVSNLIYLHRYSASISFTEPAWDSIRNEIRSIFPKTDSLYLTTRQKSHCIEVSFFQSIKEMGQWMKFAYAAFWHLFGRHYAFENVRHYSVVGTI